MPHGFECDRCERFIRQDALDLECHERLRGDRVEVVRIDNPRMQSDSDGASITNADVETYTLCAGCRAAIIDDVESDDVSDAP